MSETVELYDANGEEIELPIRMEKVSGAWRCVALVACVCIPLSLWFGYESHPKEKSSTGTPFMVTIPTAAAVSTGSIPIVRDGATIGWMSSSKENPKPILQPPHNSPPLRIKVGPFQYSVKFTTKEALAEDGGVAQTDTEKRIIWLNPKRADLRADLMHELIHCAVNLTLYDGRLRTAYDGEEGNVDSIDVAMLEIVRDNPKLVKWLQQ